MTHEFDAGYDHEPFKSLVETFPGTAVYPQDAFRTEWGPIFHRGRLDGFARVLVIGQDPAATETITRRILCGAAGQRMQGFLTRLGIDRGYVCVNTFLYSVYGQGGGEHHIGDKGIADYRNEWIDALCNAGTVEVIIALGHLADTAHSMWDAITKVNPKPAYVHMLHPTYPDSASASGTITKKEAMKRLCTDWNRALDELWPVVTPEIAVTHQHYGDTLKPDDLVDIPERDVPPGLPDWMRQGTGWAARSGTTPAGKRATIKVQAPKSALP
jgi:uracil-DNA glycosylase